MLTEKMEVKGYIFVAPWLPEVEEWEKLLNTLKDRSIKGYIVCGDQDEDCFECTQKFVALLQKKNIEYKYKVIEGLNYDYTENFEESHEKQLDILRRQIYKKFRLKKGPSSVMDLFCIL